MAFDAVLGKQTFKEKQVIDVSHPPVILSLPVKANQGTLESGLIVALNAEGLVVPYTRYEYLSETEDYRFTLGTGDGTTNTFSGTLPDFPVAKLSVQVQAGNVTGVDDGCGRIVGAGLTGTINYETGEMSVTFDTAPANGTPVKVAYASFNSL